MKSTQIYTHVALRQLNANRVATHPAKSRRQAVKNGDEPIAEDGLAALAEEASAENEAASPLLRSDPR